ncbi:cell wall-binding repeat-containing protein [Candidatus Clostridium stratigraminis]|uniref:Cell wall-binding repeat-containing protein n=1 Tax=Candidatus Clostridium stratigraminis TaxID=3381661 RepID=A0ABW8T4V0_9CLOT
MLRSRRIFSVILAMLFLCMALNTTPVFAQDTNVETARLYGSDRYATSVAVSRYGWVQANTVIIATGLDYPDALSASALAKSNNAPILLTEKDALRLDILTEIERLKATKAFLVGGTGAIGVRVEEQLKGAGINTTRIGGVNRYETSKLVAEQLGIDNGIIITTGLNFPDALSIAPIAGIKSMPILLSPNAYLDPYVSSFIKDKNISVSYLAGGTGVIAPQIASTVTNSKRLGGVDRYETNQIINNEFAEDLNFDTVYLVTGNNFPDALSGSALAAKNNAPIFLTDKNSISSNAINQLKDKGVKKVIILGGTGVVSQNVEDSITNMWKNQLIIDKIKGKGDAEQAIVVTTSDFNTANATVTTFEKANGTWKQILSVPGVIGINGFSSNRHEGDLTTPVGIYSLGTGFGKYGNPGTAMPYRQTTPNDIWADDEAHYNTWVTDPSISGEHLLRSDWLYDYAFVINFNIPERTLGKGSGIFFHCWRSYNNGTAGCVATEESNTLKILRWLDPSKQPVIIMGPISSVLGM